MSSADVNIAAFPIPTSPSSRPIGSTDPLINPPFDPPGDHVDPPPLTAPLFLQTCVPAACPPPPRARHCPPTAARAAPGSPNGEPVTTIPSDWGQAYQFFESESTLLPALETTIRDIHKLVGNADPDECEANLKRVWARRQPPHTHTHTHRHHHRGGIHVRARPARSGGKRRSSCPAVTYRRR